MARELIYQRVDTRILSNFRDYPTVYPEIRKWCSRHFGPSVIKGSKERPWHGKLETYWTPEGRQHRAAFYFRDRAAATFFALHWS